MSVIGLTSYAVAREMLNVVRLNVATFNANSSLAMSGFQILPTPTTAGNINPTDPYAYLKVGDREVVPPGLTLCFCPVSNTEEEATTQYGVDRNYRIDIVAYLRQAKDPEKLNRALEGVSAGMEDFWNDRSRYSLPVPGTGGGVQKGKIFQTNYYTVHKEQMREDLYVVLMSYRCYAGYSR